MEEKIKFLCISDWKSNCKCAARWCKRLAQMSDEDIIKLISIDHEETLK